MTYEDPEIHEEEHGVLRIEIAIAEGECYHAQHLKEGQHAHHSVELVLGVGDAVRKRGNDVLDAEVRSAHGDDLAQGQVKRYTVLLKS